MSGSTVLAWLMVSATYIHCHGGLGNRFSFGCWTFGMITVRVGKHKALGQLEQMRLINNIPIQRQKSRC